VVRGGPLPSLVELRSRETGERKAGVRLVVAPSSNDVPFLGNQLTFQCFDGSSNPCGARAWPARDPRSFVSIETQLEPPIGAIAFSVRPPEGANEDLERGTLFGFRVIVLEKAYLLLVGGEERGGVLADGTPYRVFAAKRGDWSTVSVDLWQRLSEWNAPLGSSLLRITHFPDIEPNRPVVRFQMFVTSAVQASAEFGPIVNAEPEYDPEKAFLRSLRPAGFTDRWHGTRNLREGNLDEAVASLAQARTVDTSSETLLEYADAAMLAKNAAAAAEAYDELAKSGYKPAYVNLGLGFKALNENRCPEALRAFDASVTAFEAEANADDQRYGEPHALVGLMITNDQCGDCAKAVELNARLRERGRPLEPPQCRK
jgi:hypothetical protein